MVIRSGLPVEVTELMQRGMFSAAFMKKGNILRYGLDLTTGIAGGGGIEVGSGLMIAPGLQVESKIGSLSASEIKPKTEIFPRRYVPVRYTLVWN